MTENNYVRGVVEATAVLASGWRDRLIRFETPRTNGVVAWCLDPHDLWISKAIASREKDGEFCRALCKAAIVDSDKLRQLLPSVDDLDSTTRATVQVWIDGCGGSSR